MLDGVFIEVVTVGELWSLGWLKGGYSRLIKVDALKQVSEAPWDKVMQCYLPPLPHPPPPPMGTGSIMWPPEWLQRRRGLQRCNLRLLFSANYYFGTLFTRYLIEVNCFSLSKTNSCIYEKMCTILFYLGGSGIMNFVLCWVCCCQLIAFFFWNVIAKST